MNRLEIKAIEKKYAAHTVIPTLSLEVQDGEFMVFVGPSGCGKSTLLRMIAGLESITAGDICLNGRSLNKVHPSRREVAMVFQSYALYPHLTVEQNIGFPLKMAGISKARIAQSVRHTADKLQLTPLLSRLPGELSGGQRQRVAIGRAIVRDPQLFLFDEPLSNLDAKLRSEMRIYLKQLHQQLKRTIIYVTHDQVEAMTLADRIVVLNQGRIEQIGTPQDLYDTPANLFVATFIGSPVMNILKARSLAPSLDWTRLPKGCATLGIRPHQVMVDPLHPELHITIEVVEPLGHARLYYGQLFGSPFVVESSANYEVGDRLPINLTRSVLHCFNGSGSRLAQPAAEAVHAA